MEESAQYVQKLLDFKMFIVHCISLFTINTTRALAKLGPFIILITWRNLELNS